MDSVALARKACVKWRVFTFEKQLERRAVKHAEKYASRNAIKFWHGQVTQGHERRRQQIYLQSKLVFMRTKILWTTWRNNYEISKGLSRKMKVAARAHRIRQLSHAISKYHIFLQERRIQNTQVAKAIAFSNARETREAWWQWQIARVRRLKEHTFIRSALAFASQTLQKSTFQRWRTYTHQTSAVDKLRIELADDFAVPIVYKYYFKRWKGDYMRLARVESQQNHAADLMIMKRWMLHWRNALVLQRRRQDALSRVLDSSIVRTAQYTWKLWTRSVQATAMRQMLLKRRFLHVWQASLLKLKEVRFTRKVQLHKLSNAVHILHQHALDRASAKERLRMAKRHSYQSQLALGVKQWAHHVKMVRVWRMVVSHDRKVFLTRMFRIWQSNVRFVLQLVESEEIAIAQDTYSLKKRFFKSMLSKLRGIRLDVHLSAVAARHYQKVQLRRWKQVTDARLQRHKQVERASRHHQHVLISKVLRAWQFEQRKITSIERSLQSMFFDNGGEMYYPTGLQRIVFRHWILQLKQRRKEKLRELVAQKHARHVICRSMWNKWRARGKQVVAFRGSVLHASAHYRVRTSRHFFNVWCVFVAQQHRKAQIREGSLEGPERRLQLLVSMKWFQRWRQLHGDIMKARQFRKARALAVWTDFHVVQRKKVLILQMAEEVYRLSLVRKMLSNWRTLYHVQTEDLYKRYIAVTHWSRGLCARVWRRWMLYHARQCAKKKHRKEILALRRKELMQEGVSLWIRNAFVQQNNRATVAHRRRVQENENLWNTVSRLAQHWRKVARRRAREKARLFGSRTNTAIPVTSFASSDVMVLSGLSLTEKLDLMSKPRKRPSPRIPTQLFASMEAEPRPNETSLLAPKTLFPVAVPKVVTDAFAANAVMSLTEEVSYIEQELDQYAELCAGLVTCARELRALESSLDGDQASEALQQRLSSLETCYAELMEEKERDNRQIQSLAKRLDELMKASTSTSHNI